ncbi:flavonoid 3'-monooxygenase CYP75B137-like [Magnolia sinica]|uniref:flavonoid 3'-monooxygenase CYP75B137-like n=1 Tax=Magnolia sinica TaxID=86752 RepID=UPI002659C56A|nr:flavonoid 3'-monooxygenase CYP75B137-like [Magnolia sinica]
MATSNTISGIWSWWWEGTNQQDEFARSTLTISLAVLAIAWYVWPIVKSKSSASGLPPGPRGLPLVGNLPFLDPELHVYFAKLARVHGPIFKLWLGNKLGIVISSPALAKEVLKDHDTTFANRDVPAAARVIAYGGSDIVWTPYGPEWRMLRKVCVREMLSGASLDAVYALRRREVRATVSHMYKNSGVPINVGEQMFLTVMNVITSMLWGGTLKGEERTSLGAEFRQIVNEITELLGKPNVSDFFSGLARFDLQGMERQMKGPLARFDRIFELIIDQRLKIDREEAEGKSSEKGSRDFLQFLLKMKDEGDSKTPLTMTHLKALLMDMVVGGTDTTSNTVEWAIAEMMQKPETMRKAQVELEAVVGRDNIVEESHIPKLHYLEAVVKEVLRLHPALPLMVPHCPSQTCTVGGYTVPKGSRVFVNVWAVHRDPSIWSNPSEFDPGRFLRTDYKWDFSGNDFHYFPFGSGRRICAGITMAERMVMYSLGSLVHSFEWRLPEGSKGDLTEKFGIVMKKATPLIAIPTPRLSNPELYA